MSSSMKGSTFALIKDFPITVPTPGWIWICPKHITFKLNPNRPRYSAVVHSSRKTVIDDLREYIQELQTRNRMLLKLRSKCEDDEQVVIHIKMQQDTLERICEIVPQPYLQVVGVINDPQSGNGEGAATIFDKAFSLTDLALNRRGLREQLFCTSELTLSPDRKFSCSITLGWTEPPKPETNSVKISVTSFMETLYGREDCKDLKIIVGNGAHLKCHRIIFEAQSDVLAAMVSPTNGMMESTTGTIEMKENSEEGLSHLISYLYGKELATDELSCDVVIELFKTSHKYKLTELLECLVQTLLGKGRDWFTPDDLLDLYFHVKNLVEFESLCEFTLSIMISLSQEIRTCDRYQELKRTDPEAAYDLLWKLFDMVNI